jgi:hypothetical protein
MDDFLHSGEKGTRTTPFLETANYVRVFFFLMTNNGEKSRRLFMVA